MLRMLPTAADETGHVGQALPRPYPAERLRAFPISTRVNRPKNDDPAIIEPVAI